MKRQKSPCIDKCEFSGSQGWCTAYGRTLEECKKWKKMKPYDRNILENDLKKRMAQMTN